MKKETFVKIMRDRKETRCETAEGYKYVLKFKEGVITCFIDKRKNAWYITEAETGLSFDGYGFDTIKQALEHIAEEHVKFIELLKRHSSLVEECRKKIAEFKSA